MFCDENLAGDGKDIKCTECNFSYHVGDCSGVNESVAKGKKQAFRESWKCQTCKSAKARPKSTLDDRKTREGDMQKQLADIAQKLTLLVPLKEKVDEIASVKETVEEIEKAMQLLSTKYDVIMEKLSTQDKEMSAVKKRVEKLEESQNGAEVAKLRQDLNTLEQYGRLNNLEVHGVRMTDHENLLEKMNSVAVRLQVKPLSPDDVEAIHRVPSKTGKTPVVLIRFLNRSRRDEWLKNKNKLRNGQEDSTQIYLQENLTESNRKNFFEARERAKLKGYRFTWHKNGVTYVRKQEGEKAIRIQSCKDFDKIR